MSAICKNLLNNDEEYQIETTSIFMKHVKVKLMSAPLNLSFPFGSSILLPSICNRTQKCLEFVTLKVKLLFEKLSLWLI